MGVKSSPLLSIVITAHAESILLHKTLLSVIRAAAELPPDATELILHLDNPSKETLSYIAANKPFLEQFATHTNSFGDAGQSRNFATKQASGEFVTFIDGDDLMSKNWLLGGVTALQESVNKNAVAHSESVVEFGDTYALVLRHASMGREIDTMLSVYANRGNAIIMTRRQIILDNPYIKTKPGYGYEDWHLMNRLIAKGTTDILVPRTAIFVRRKSTNSRWAHHKASAAILPSNPLLSFPNIRSISADSLGRVKSEHGVDAGPLTIRIAKKALKKHPKLKKIAIFGKTKMNTAIGMLPLPTKTPLPGWLIDEMRAISTIDRLLFPQAATINKLHVYDSITPDHWKAGIAYKEIVDTLKHDTYSYILFVPWLVGGGADEYAINYANTIQQIEPSKRVLVVATSKYESTWTSRLAPEIDFIHLGAYTTDLTREVNNRLIEHLVENSGAECLHILNSELAYNFVADHATYIANSGKHVIVTSFSQSIDKTGRIFGYSHTHVPVIYDLASFITSDNQTVLDMWQREYGFDSAKLLLHRQPVAVGELPPGRQQGEEPLKVLWAARLSPEKIPTIVAEIGRLVEGENVIIDMFGRIDEGFNAKFLKSLPRNVTYKGPFDGFNSLPVDDYDAFLYTSIFDGMPNALLDAGKAGLPIVSSDAGGIGELVQNGKTGFLITGVHQAAEYSHALIHLQDQTLREKLRKNMRNVLVESFSPASYQRNIHALLDKINYKN